ncbi:McrC family protein [Geobacter sp.]|uniref:McrC family protein n=1 Tax=Geobacter sp. TaxID=46610 RepID=UPI001AC8C94A|nr:hypothetical protein [Geobacter sp.]CAG0947709.1 hypothetical protein ANRL1_04456 [Anaerolineae bacterium]
MPAFDHTLQLKEFERIPVGPQWDSHARTVGAGDVAAIERFQAKSGRELLKLGYRSIQGTNWVGTLGVGRRCLEVIPKIDDPAGPLDARRTRENLLWMVSRAGMVPIEPADIARLADPQRPLLAAFLDLYVDHLAREWQRGPIKEYLAEEENRAYLRGKLLFPQQQRHNLIQQQRFFTAADEFTMDSPLSRLLKAGLRCCARQRMSDLVVRKARGLLMEFADVSDWEFSNQEAEQLQVSRQHFRYELLINMARLILQSTSPETGGDGRQVYSLMFDMNEVFERFVAAEMKTALAGTKLAVIAQLGGRSLLTQRGKPRFHLRPDIGVYRRDELVCLIDTKWKRLDLNKPHAGVSQADIYQMYAYGKEYGSALTVILYPRWGSLPEIVAGYEHNDPLLIAEQKGIEIRTLDVGGPFSLPVHRRAFAESLFRLIPNDLCQNTLQA